MDLENYITLKNYVKERDLDYFQTYNRIKGKVNNIFKLHPRAFMYDRNELDDILKKYTEKK